jgi:Protein of unknown function (DUF4238)
MSRSKNHHHVSQFYLRNFADERGHVHVRDIETGSAFSRSIEHVASETNLYTFQDAEGKPNDSIETNILARFEGIVAPRLQRLVDEPSPLPLSRTDRVLIAQYMVLQRGRSPWMRDFLKDSHDLFMRFEIEANVGGSSPEDVERFIAKRFADLSDREKDEIRKVAADPNQPYEIATEDWIIPVIGLVPEHAKLLTKRRWNLLDARGGWFLTSDSPVLLIGTIPLGVETAVGIFLPLSPKRALFIEGDDDGHQYAGISRVPQINTFNQLMAEQAMRQVFYHPSTSPLDAIRLPNEPPSLSINGIPVHRRERSYNKIRDDYMAMARRVQSEKRARPPAPRS